MDSNAYFVGRSELLNWINSTLGLRLSKIEETASGAVACQLLDALHPGGVQMSKVDFNAKTDYDYINNYKVLQNGFNKLGIDKHVEVQKLIKARPLDNMEFMQWFKSYHDQVTQGAGVRDYDGPARRQLCKTGDVRGAGKGPAKSKIAGDNGSASGAPKPHHSTPARTGSIKAAGNHSDKGDKSDTVEQLKQQIAEWRLRSEVLEREKNFFFSKLRDIEMLCQTPVISDIPVVKEVEKILYAPTEEEGHKALENAQLEFTGQIYQGEPVAGEEQVEN